MNTSFPLSPLPSSIKAGTTAQTQGFGKAIYDQSVSYRLTPILILGLSLLLQVSQGAEDRIAWGEPVKGLRLGIKNAPSSATSDQELTFTVVLQNVSEKTIALPDPGTFSLKKDLQSEDYHAAPLFPLIEMTRFSPPLGESESPWGMGNGVPVGQSPDAVIILAPSETVAWDSVRLEKYDYYGDCLPPKMNTRVQHWYLLPGYVFHIKFRFENEKKKITGKEVWTGILDSGLADLKVNPPSLEGIKLKGEFTVPKKKYFRGEPIETTFTVANSGEQRVTYPAGGDYRASGRHDRFSFQAFDANGKKVPDPVKPSGFGGGLGGEKEINPGESVSENLLINQWCAFPGPGIYQITCKRTLNVRRRDLNKPETEWSPESKFPSLPIETKLTIEIEDDPAALKKYIEKLVPALLGGGNDYYQSSIEMRCLAEAKILEALPAITQLLSGPPDIQVKAVGWISAYEPDQVASILLEHCAKLNPGARYRALHTLCEWKTPGTGPLLAAALRDPDASLRGNTVLLYSKNPNQECLPIILTMGKDPNPLVRRYLGAALGASGDPRAVPILKRLLQDRNPDPYIKIWAAEGLGKLKNRAGVPVLIQLLGNAKVKNHWGNVLAALEEISGQEFNSNRKRALEWWKKTGYKEQDKGL